MKLGIIGGGFKPFTSGHFTLLATAMKYSDQVVLYYGLAGRKKGSGYNYSREMSEEVFHIVKQAIEREYAGRVHVVLGRPTPIVKVFEGIEAVVKGEDTKGALPGIDPRAVDTVLIFSGPEDLDKYTRYLGTDREQKYFGDLAQTGRLKLMPVTSADGEGDMSAILDIVRSAYPDIDDEEMTQRVQMRGSIFRSLISNRDVSQISRFLPPFLNDNEKAKIANILFRGLSENVLRQYVSETLRRL